MKRKIYNKLLEWKQKRARKEALLIDGARRVGKSYIAEEFGRNEYKTYILVNFGQMTADMIDIFEHDLSSPDSLFMRLQVVTGTKLYEQQSLIIFDEVQCYPKAREAIKWLVADGRYDYIETGSLVSIRKNTEGIIIPSEEYHIDMFPMDYEEFLWAMGEEMLMPWAAKCLEERKPMGAAIHRKMMELLRMYMVIGGMPQAVEEYVRSKDFDEVDHVKRNILALYRNDIYQYAGNDAAKVASIFDAIPGQLQKHEKRFRIGQMKKGARTRDYSEAFFWIDEARVVNTCYAATEPSIGLKLNRDDSRYKLYFADTGLLVSHTFDDSDSSMQDVYRKIILGKLEMNSGMLVENLVAQMLRASGKKLYYFSKKDRENSEETMEIDFLVRKANITSRHNICPVEVKSTQRYTTSSLNKFCRKYDTYLHTPYIIHSGDLKVEGNTLFIPLYMTPLL